MTVKDVDRIRQLIALGQSVWVDSISRSALENGETRSLIDRGQIRGMTSNPTIFSQAISGSHDYDEALKALAWAGWDSEKIFWELAVEDVRLALDLFSPLYELTNGSDGYVSIEVSPHLAYDTDGSVAQAEQLWARVGRSNLMVKIPATEAGIPAIRRSVSAGLNINITLIFSRARYAQVMDAFLAGLEERVAAGKPIGHMASVASFFVSRVDTKIDKRLPADSRLRGRAGIANARLAYQDFLRTFSGERWEKLRAAGARLQRPLWASTSAKDPAYPDTMYVDQLIGADTVNTVPLQTLEAARDHANVRISINDDLDDARRTMASLEAAGISMEEVTSELESEGVASFSKSLEELLKNIESRRLEATSFLGPLAQPVSNRIGRVTADAFLTRLWSKDPTLWSNEPAAQAEIGRRLGWLQSLQQARERMKEHLEFAAQVRAEGIRRILVVGMGGSSVTAELLSSLFKAPDKDDPDAVCLGILDSTDPAQILKAAQDFTPERSLYVIASKSGGTTEVSAAFEFLWSRSGSDPSHFVAITDDGTSLHQLADRLQFRRVFLADSTVGGRFSALTDFGLVPAALLGVDVSRLIDRAEWMQRQCGRDIPPARSPGVVLGALLGEGAVSGRDKLTILADPELEALPHWIEQLIAESSGKLGKGIIPVVLEPLAAPSAYGRDRFFVYLRQTGVLDGGVEALVRAGFPAVSIEVPSAHDIGAEFYRWEVAASVACHILGVNPFDQPDVQDSKDRTREKVEKFRATQRLAEGEWDLSIQDGTQARRSSQDLRAFLEQARPNDYVALNAYLPRRREIADGLQALRQKIRSRTGAAVTAGFGPRFQHSTGQIQKGGASSGFFIQIVSDAGEDVDIPGQGMSFGTLIRAQALGDYEALGARGRRVFRIHLTRPEDLVRLTEML